MGRIKASLQSLMGKTIDSVVVAQFADSKPKSQLFLIFTDGTSYEFWIDDSEFSVASAIDNADKESVLRHLRKRAKREVWSFDSSGSQHEKW